MNNLTSGLSHPMCHSFKWLCVAVLSTMCLAAVVPFRGHAETIIFHSGLTSSEDGNKAKDADGTKNGVVVWAGGGVVHVVLRVFSVAPALKIENGAVVKFASNVFDTWDHCRVSDND
jgi:hypothetical protein